MAEWVVKHPCGFRDESPYSFPPCQWLDTSWPTELQITAALRDEATT